MDDDFYILGIESSCDDTSVAITNKNHVLSNIISSQLVHNQYGGVVPEIASRDQISNWVFWVYWWSYRANSRNKNLGWRIDYHILSKSLNSKIVRSSILSEVNHSDHCPILLELNL